MVVECVCARATESPSLLLTHSAVSNIEEGGSECLGVKDGGVLSSVQGLVGYVRMVVGGRRVCWRRRQLGGLWAGRRACWVALTFCMMIHVTTYLNGRFSFSRSRRQSDAMLLITCGHVRRVAGDGGGGADGGGADGGCVTAAAAAAAAAAGGVP